MLKHQPGFRCRHFLLALGFACAYCAVSVTYAKEFVSPDILILGDSQIPFGSGPAFLEVFSDIKQYCRPDDKHRSNLAKLGEMKVAVLGVRSTSLRSWTARSGTDKGRVCDVDPTWNVNAGSYGVLNETDNKYVQIGQGEQYQFCEQDRSPFETMFREDYYRPKLLLFSFLGNSAKRWATDKDEAVSDVLAMMSQVPENIPCIFMTTAPPYSKTNTEIRLRAQNNLRMAFHETGNRCTFVPGSTPGTVAANQGNKKYFRLNADGIVSDPYHPNQVAAKNFFALERDDICSAIFEQVEKVSDSS